MVCIQQCITCKMNTLTCDAFSNLCAERLCPSLPGRRAGHLDLRVICHVTGIVVHDCQCVSESVHYQESGDFILGGNASFNISVAASPSRRARRPFGAAPCEPCLSSMSRTSFNSLALIGMAAAAVNAAGGESVIG